MNLLSKVMFNLAAVAGTQVVNNITNAIQNVIDIAQKSVAIIAALCIVGVGITLFWGGQNAKDIAKERIKVIFIAAGIIMLATNVASWGVGLFG